jgi:beta-glucosidase
MNGMLVVAASVLWTGQSGAQRPLPLTPAENQRIEEIVKSMTLQQKIDFIGGTGFTVRAEPELKIPALEMSDGPYGVRSNAGFPSTTCPSLSTTCDA